MDGLSLLITGDVKMYNAHEHRLPQLCDVINARVQGEIITKFASPQCQQQHNVIPQEKYFIIRNVPSNSILETPLTATTALCNGNVPVGAYNK